MHIEALEKRKTYYVCFTIAFAVVCIAAFMPIFATGHTPIWGDADGLTIHYATFAYMGKWIREGLATGVFPQWDYSMGYGSDVLIYNANDGGFEDPFNLVAALVPMQYAECAFVVVIFVKLYLCGFFFSMFCRSKNANGLGTLCGAIVYTFCGFCLSYGAFRHPTFLMPAFMLPLVLMGIDRIFDKRKPLLYIVTIFLTIFMHFYFGYMVLLLGGLYFLYRYFLTPRSRSAKGFFVLLGKFVVYSLIGLLATCVVVLPLVNAVMTTPRVGVSTEVQINEWLYQNQFAPSNFIGGTYSVVGLCVGAFAAFCVAALFAIKERESAALRKGLRIAFVAAVVVALVPFADSVLNGFSYPTDRWMFGFAFIVACIVAYAIPRIHLIERRGWLLILLVGLVLAAWVAVGAQYVGETLWALLAPALFFITAALLYETSRKTSGKAFGISAVLCCLMSMALLGWGLETSLYLVPDSRTAIDSMRYFGTAYDDMVAKNPEALLVQQQEGQLQRSDEYNPKLNLNSAMLVGLRAENYYTDFSNARVFAFRSELGLVTGTSQDQNYRSNDGHAYLEAFLGVKNFLVRESQEGYLPYGFTDKVAHGLYNGKNYEVYSSENALPLAYMFDTTISRSTYDALSAEQKQEALLQGCVVDGASEPSITPSTSSQSIPYTILDNGKNGVKVTGSTYHVSRKDGSLTLSFETPSNGETYLDVKGAHLDKLIRSKNGKLRQGTQMKVASSKQQRTVNIDSRSNVYSAGVDSWSVNCGYQDTPQTTIKITFQDEGDYQIDDMKVGFLPMGQLSERVAALNDGSVCDLKLATDEITGKTSTDRQRLLFLSIPYSKGWTAYIDGVKTDIMCADTAFMAVDMPAGDHEFKLVYRTPYF